MSGITNGRDERGGVELLERSPVASGHFGAHTLAQYAASELGSERHAEVAAHLAGCDRCRARLDDEDAERRAFLARRPTGAFLAALERRRPEPWWRRFRWQPWLGAALAAAAMVALVVQSGALTNADGPGSRNRLKTAFDLSFHVRSGDVIELGKPGGIYHPGDAIQLRYSSPTEGHLVVVSVDSAGAATAFYDASGQSLQIAPAVAELLDGSVVLDDALGPERVIGCFSDTPLATDDVLGAARAALDAAGGDPRAVGALDVPCRQIGFLIDKQRPAP